MSKIGHIEITVKGYKGNLQLSPESYDIRDIKATIESVENLLFPGDKSNRPLISYKIENGSVKHIFKIVFQFVLAFEAILAQINTTGSIDFMEAASARAIEELQKKAKINHHLISITTSKQSSACIEITPDTDYQRTIEHWAEAELYFYGRITNAGGKQKANIHLFTEEYGTVIISTPQNFLADRDDNLLYKYFGVRASGLQNLINGEVDVSSLKFIDLIDYDKTRDQNYLKSLRNRAKNWLAKTSAEEYLKEIREYDD